MDTLLPKPTRHP